MEAKTGNGLKRAALVSLLLGILLLLGSCAPFGLAVKRGFGAHETYSVRMHSAGESESRVFQVDTSQHVMLEIDARVESSHAQRKDDDYEALYHIPLHYQILDPEGRVLAEERTALRHGSGTRAFGDSELGPDGGWAEIGTSFEKHKLPPPGDVRVRLWIGEDSSYGATLSDVVVTVYDRVYTHTAAVMTGLGMLLLGFLLMLGSLVLFIAWGASARAVVAGAADPSARQIAMLAHISAMAGWVLPLGGLLGPLLVWQLNREKDPFIDEQGREAVNFRLSMMLYYLAATLFMFLLIGFLVLPLLIIADLVLVIVAAMRAGTGEHYRYPLTIRFIQG